MNQETQQQVVDVLREICEGQRYPRLSFMGDWRLWWEILTGKVRF
jgi:hypothetical protein